MNRFRNQILVMVLAGLLGARAWGQEQQVQGQVIVQANAGIYTRSGQVLKPNTQEEAEKAAAAAKGMPEKINGLPVAFVPMVQQGPAIKGDLSDPAWGQATTLKLVNDLTGQEAPYPSTVKFLCTGDSLYIGAKFDEPNMKGLVTTGEFSYENDCFEFFIFPSSNTVRKLYYQAALDAGNKVMGWHTHLYIKNSMQGESSPWMADFQHATAHQDKSWTAELRIPFASMEFPPEALGKNTVWRMNIHRSRPVRGTDAEARIGWSPGMNREYHLPTKFGYLVMGAFATPELVKNFPAMLTANASVAKPTAEQLQAVDAEILHLGDDAWAVRDRASKELESMARQSRGLVPAIESAAKKANETSTDGEVKTRTEQLMKYLQDIMDPDDDPLPAEMLPNAAPAPGDNAPIVPQVIRD